MSTSAFLFQFKNREKQKCQFSKNTKSDCHNSKIQTLSVGKDTMNAVTVYIKK